MYYSSEEKTRKKINKIAKKSKKFYYNFEVYKEKITYIQSLRGIFNHSSENWISDETKIFEKLGTHLEQNDDFENFSNFFIDQLRSNKELEQTYLPIFSESEIRFWFGICRTRMYNIKLNDYQNFRGHNLEDVYGGSMNVESLKMLNGNFLICY